MLDRRNDNVYMYISIISVYCIQYVLAYVIYNGTIFNILSCNTEQSLDYVDALSKKKKKCYELFTACMIIFFLQRLVFEVS